MLNNSDYSQTKLISLHDGNTTLMDANCNKNQQKNKKDAARQNVQAYSRRHLIFSSVYIVGGHSVVAIL